MKLTLGALLSVLCLPAFAQDVNRSIENVVGDVYLMRNNFHNSLLVATGEGAIRVDPINTGAGEWLNDNLSRIGEEKISHLIYSHSHGDHASGGTAHADAISLAHEDAPETIDGVTPSVRVGDSHTLTVGTKTIELTNLGGGHDTHMLVVIVRPENAAFIVDVAAPKRLPFRNFGGADIDQWLGQIEAAQSLDFEYFVPGHGAVGTKADLDDAHTYLVDLKSAVLDGLRDGKTVDELQADILLEEYSDWGQYASWRVENIEGMARHLQSTDQVN